MPTTGKNQRDAPSARGGTMDCQPLLDLTTPEMFRRNPFRIIGLPVTATDRQVASQVEKLRQMAELNIAANLHQGQLSLTPSPTVDDLREAHQTLKDPEKRFIYEMFWFWPEDFANAQFDNAFQALVAGDCDTALRIWTAKENNSPNGAVISHNLAVFWQLKALDQEISPGFSPLARNALKHLEECWRPASDRWRRIASDDVLWEKVAQRITLTGEARLTTGLVRRVRATLPAALGKVHAQLALTYSQSGAKELAQMHVGFMREAVIDVSASDQVAEVILEPTVSRVQEHIRNARLAVNAAPTKSDQAARELIDLALPLCETFGLFYGSGSHAAKEILDDVATACLSCLVAFQKSTRNNRTFCELLTRALPLVQSDEVRQRFQSNIQIGKDNIQIEQSNLASATLKAIHESTDIPRLSLQRFRSEAVPAIRAVVKISAVSSSYGPLSSEPGTDVELLDQAAIVLRNISLAAWNNHQDKSTALEANEMALQYATKPDLRKLLTDDRLTMRPAGASRNEQENRSKPPPAHRQPKLDKLPQVLAFVIASLAIVILGSFKSCDQHSSTANIVAPPPPPPQPTPTVYRVPRSTSVELSADKALIDQEELKASLLESKLKVSAKDVDAKRTELDELESGLDSLNRQLDRERVDLDRTSQFAIDDFNLKVGRYNSAIRNRKDEVEVFNKMVQSHNAIVQELKSQNRLVNELVYNYNQKLSRSGR